MADYYQILGVDRTASQEDIKRAYRRLASQHHPDKGGDTTRFQEIQQAYAVLGDEQQRSQYDNPRPDFGFNPGASPNIQDIFAQMFGQTGFGAHHPRRNHARMNLWISLADVAHGGRKTVSVGTPHGQNTIEIDIPLGINDGDSVQYGGLAPGGQDLVITFRINQEPRWSRSGLDLTFDYSADIWTLIVGGDITVANILGERFAVRVPSRTQPGALLRLKSQGLKDRRGLQGDMFVRLSARIPDQIPEELVAAIEKYRR